MDPRPPAPPSLPTRRWSATSVFLSPNISETKKCFSGLRGYCRATLAAKHLGQPGRRFAVLQKHSELYHVEPQCHFLVRRQFLGQRPALGKVSAEWKAAISAFGISYSQS